MTVLRPDIPDSAERLPGNGNSPYNPTFDDTELINHLMEAQQPYNPGGGGLVLFKFDGTDPISDIARISEARNFAEGYVTGNGNVPNPKKVEAELRANYEPYDGHSTFLYLLDVTSS